TTTGGSGGATTPSGGGTTTTGSGGTAPVTGAAPAPGDKGTTTGIDLKAKTVKIALHGPLTGAGVPQESFRTGTPKYWNDGPGGKPRLLKNGFRVIAEAIDDKYNAPDALRACNAAAKEYFLIVGGAGTDQIQACAQSQVLRRGNVPYLSAGVTESGLGALPNYFATSLTYKQQGPLVVKMAKDNGFFAGKWAVVITEGPNFADARTSIVDALKANGAQFDPSKDVYLTDKAPQNCSALGTQVRGGGYGTIYFLGQPAFFAQCVGVIGAGPTYTGPGPSFGINTVARLACGAAAGQYKGFYLHPATGLDQAAKRAPGVSFQDDIEYQIYGAMQGLEAAFNKVEGTLTREKFIAALRGSSIPDGIAPGASYVGDVRFGGKAAFALKANCSTNQYATLKQYAK
ncbi:MAG: hypothetical protein JWN08_2960, partial [Frankiales bacterium]|nr:hypothetical protein [Frankiales bacterium]